MGLVLGAALSLAPAHARGASTPKPEPPPPLPSPRPDEATGTTAFPGGVGAQFDITYASPSGAAPLTLDIYRPQAKSSASLPIVVYIHGGSWKNGDSRHAISFTDLPHALAGLAAQGYVVASVNYRLSPQVRFPTALQDVKSAMRWLRGHAASLGGDPTRLAVWGASAGGQLAAMAGVSCGVMAFEPQTDGPQKPDYDAPSDCAEAVIDWFGPVDFENATNSDVAAYLGCEPKACAPGQVRQASPLAFISVSAPPFLIQHGAVDTEVLPSQAQMLYDALKKKGVPADIALYPDVGHGFMRDGKPDAAMVTKAMTRLSAFLVATFPPAPVKQPQKSRSQRR
jgi:acetyl esterase/lipase